MKKISFTIQHLSIEQQKHISMSVENFITYSFRKVIRTKNEILEASVTYFQNNPGSELILKQTITKGTFSRITWPKQDIIKQTKVSNRITTNVPKEQADPRFFSEIFTADYFLNENNNVGEIIKTIRFNSEKPQKGSFLISRGNKYKDATVDIDLNQKNAFKFDIDIKIGNNGIKDIFTGALSPLPLNEAYTPFAVLNASDYREKVDLTFIQDQRIRHFNSIKLLMPSGEATTVLFNEYLEKITVFAAINLDPIAINTLIQKELLKCISLGILYKQPSLFAITLQSKDSQTFNEKFFIKLKPYITSDIFDNQANFTYFMRKSLQIYNETVAEIAKNIESSFWQNTGFENIADDLFK